MSEPTDNSPERGPMRLSLKRELDAMFLPELHQAQWAQQMGELRDAKRHATSPEAEAVAQASIMAHYKSRHDLDATRQRLEQKYQAQEQAEAEQAKGEQ